MNLPPDFRATLLRFAPLFFGFLLLTAIGRHHRQPLVSNLFSTMPELLTEEDLRLPEPPEPEPPSRRGLRFTFPTPQTRLRDVEDPAVFMPTASGRIISAFYGSTRTNSAGGAVFHEGVDIGPMRRDRRNHALDEIFAIAEGRVAYIQPHHGNSTYGAYIVLMHQEEEFGEFYTLYAHLARIHPDLRVGQRVAKGQEIAIMGHSSSFHIPPARAHLHLEIGTMVNQHFQTWYRGKQRTPDHGNYHGHNLTGIDPLPLLLLLEPDQDVRFSVLNALLETPVAWRKVVHSPGLPDYFRRHPALWSGGPFSGGAIVLSFSEGGVILHGRPASAEEAAGVTAARPRVLDWDPAVLGRNGRRLIRTRGSTAEITPSGMEFLEIVLFRAGR